MRSAQFHVALGRLQRLLEKYDDARVQLNTAIALVKDTIDWRSSVRSAAATSFYREPAITIRDAAQAELDKLPKPAASPSPAPK
jgi:hypothetical protein